MKYQEFLPSVADNIRTKTNHSYEVELRQVTKNNGTIYDALLIHSTDQTMIPTIYLNPYYHRYLEGQTLDEICEDILKVYDNALSEIDFDMDSFMDFESMKSRIVMKLINVKQNMELLSDVPYIPFLDLAVVFECIVRCPNPNGGDGKILIHNDCASTWQVSAEELFCIAKNNTSRLRKPEVIRLSSMMTLPDLPGSMDLMILTNEEKLNGAVGLLYEELLYRCAREADSDLILIPSSIHEFILVPTSDISDYAYCNQMLNDVNSTEVMDEEILSDHIYYYSRADRAVSIPLTS